jgi:DNA-binding beta-propeller fold protein YncE
LSPRAYFYASPLVLGDSIFVVGASLAGLPQPITVFSTSAQDILVQCDSSMLMVCGDDLPAVYIHPSDKYLFLADQSTNEVPIVYISTVLSRLEVSGASIPGIPTTVAFSPDGLLVYAIEGSQILVYVFNPHSGLLTARSTINAPGVGTILPVQ